MNRFITSFTIVVVLSTACWAGPPSPKESLERAVETIDDLQKIQLKGIPAKMVADAQAIAIIPRVIKGGFVVGGRVGFGFVMTRTDKGDWSEPTFVRLGGASIGFQVGVESTDVVLVFSKKDSLDRVLSGKGKLTLGADASIAAGPIGRQASAATDGKLEAEIYSYSRSRGLFAGVSFDGAGILNDKEGNVEFRKDKRPETAKALADVKAKLMEIAKELPAKPESK